MSVRYTILLLISSAYNQLEYQDIRHKREQVVHADCNWICPFSEAWDVCWSSLGSRPLLIQHVGDWLDHHVLSALTFTSYVQGGIGEDGATFGETYILTIPSFQWTLVDHPVNTCSCEILTSLDIPRTESYSEYCNRKRLVVL